MTKKQFREATGISKSTLDKMGRSEQVSMSVIDRICTYFDSDISNIIEYIKNGEKK